MFNVNVLVDNYLDEKKLEQKSTREAFGDGIVKIAEDNSDIVVVNADLESSLKLEKFKAQFPERFIQVGVAEEGMAGVGTSLALYGKIPFITSFAAFSPALNWSPIRFAAMSGANLKIASSHYGLNIGEDGPSAQMLEDVALMRVLPNMTVVTPVDYNQTLMALEAITAMKGPVYIRFTRTAFPMITKPDAEFEVGVPQLLKSGENLTILATGSVVYEALKAAEVLEKEGISCEVFNIHTVKPLATQAIIDSLTKTGRLVTVEEHQIAGGMGSAVLEALSRDYQKSFPTLLLGVEDKFGVSGEGKEVMKQFGLERDLFMIKIKHFLNNDEQEVGRSPW